jgi:hypothetical protein
MQPEAKSFFPVVSRVPAPALLAVTASGSLRKAGLVQGCLTVRAFFGSSRLQSSNAAGTLTLLAETVIPSGAEESRKRIAYRSIAGHSSIISAYRTGTQVATLVVLAQCATNIPKTHAR